MKEETIYKSILILINVMYKNTNNVQQFLAQDSSGFGSRITGIFSM